jgi:hypothetical protein
MLCPEDCDGFWNLPSRGVRGLILFVQWLFTALVTNPSFDKTHPTYVEDWIPVNEKHGWLTTSVITTAACYSLARTFRI